MLRRALILILFFISFSSVSYASVVKINAGILPSIWYSTLDAYEGDTIKIYGGFQNHSDFKLAGEAAVIMDGKISSKINFISNPNTLSELSGEWKAIAGNHDIQIQITKITGDSSFALNTESLSDSLSESSHFSVTRKINFTSGDTASLATSGIKKIDDATEIFANKILGYKKPYATSTSKGEISGKGNQTASILESIKNSNITKGIWNTIIDFISLCIRHWKITAIALLLLIILIKYALF